MSVVSVGEGISKGQVITHTHPHYVNLTNEFTAKLNKIVERAAVARGSARQAVVTQALDAVNQLQMESEYPEFRVHWPLWDNGTHGVFRAHRQLVNQVMTNMARPYAASYVHYGGMAMAYLTAGVEDVVLHVDGTSPTALGESVDDDHAVQLYSASRAEAATRFGWTTDTELLGRYWNRRAIVKTRAKDSVYKGDALIVDGSLVGIHSKQFMAMMVEHESTIGYYALPYHSGMLVRDDGEIPGTNVWFEKTVGGLRFKYPEGVVGETFYSQAMFDCWLVNGQRDLPGVKNQVFHFETMGRRGPFLIVKVIRSEGVCDHGTVVHHSLQIDGDEDMTLVRAFELKDFNSDHRFSDSWVENKVYVGTRVLTKAYEYALACASTEFSVSTIAKRLAVVNDRVVVKGVQVVTTAPLTNETKRIVSQAIFCHAFVARYELGQLSKELRAFVEASVNFRELTKWGKLSCLFGLCAETAYDWTLGLLDDTVRTVFDKIRDRFARTPAGAMPTFDAAPQFVKFETVVKQSNGRRLMQLRRLVDSAMAAIDVRHGVAGACYSSITAAGSCPEVDNPLDCVTITRNGVDIFCDVVENLDHEGGGPAVDNFVAAVSAMTPMGQRGPNGKTYYQTVVQASNEDDGVSPVQFTVDNGYVTTLNDFHEAVVPAMAVADIKYDPSSLMTDDQLRDIEADKLVLPAVFATVPGKKSVYVSRLKGFDLPKLDQNLQAQLSAMTARNLAVPVLETPQHRSDTVKKLIENFKQTACRLDAVQEIERMRAEPIELDEESLRAWGNKATAQKIARAIAAFVEDPKAFEELRVDRNDTMIKSDLKPPLSDKPVLQVLQPQTIVHLTTEVNAIYSAIFRQVADRFLSIIHPRFLIGIRKSSDKIRAHIQAYHVWSKKNKFIENDFGKFDKSQQETMMDMLEEMFKWLGLDEIMLAHWMAGQRECTISSMTLGLKLWIRNQQKSGSPITSLANVMVNMVTVLYVYRGTEIEWGTFTGDDSLMEVGTVVGDVDSNRVFAEMFNLEAKLYVTDAPYFASYFVLINDENVTVNLVPDPLKRVEKWSMSIPSVDPKWEERYESAREACEVYMRRDRVVGLDAAVRARYPVKENFEVLSVVDAIATAISSLERFRAMYEAHVTTIVV